jgi:hypothetical protein
MPDYVIPLGGLAVLALCCLPWRGAQRAVLCVTALALRLAALAVLGTAAYWTLRPDQMPADVVDVLAAVPQLRDVLPDVGAPHFAAVLAALVVAPAVIVLALIDVARRPRPLDVVAVVPAAPAPPSPARFGRRAAADALAALGGRPGRR